MPNGYKVAPAGGKGNPEPSKRGQVRGWSKGSARRNDEFLRSVDVSALSELLSHTAQNGDRTHVAYSASLTMRDCPPSYSAFEAVLRLYLDWLRKQPGCLFVHVLTEWQPREKHGGISCPHVHMIVFWDLRCTGFGPIYRVCPGQHPARCGPGLASLRWRWVDYAAAYGASDQAQHVEEVYDISGWLKYLGKHGSRGIYHYQRSAHLVPAAWAKTGQMWKRWGAWPVDVRSHHMSPAAFYALRRFLNRYQAADARKAMLKAPRSSEGGHRRRMSYLRRRLIKPADWSRFIGLSDWGSDRVLAAWLQRSCIDLGHDPATGEVCSYFVLPAEFSPSPSSVSASSVMQGAVGAAHRSEGPPLGGIGPVQPD